MIFQSTLPSQGATWGAWTGTYDTQTFQSTLPSQGATSNGNSRGVVVGFQSTLPSQGATVRQWFLRRRPRDFNPRSPHRERRLASRNFKKLCNFNPRSPHRERPSLLFRCPNLPYFNPRSPHRERRLSVTIHVHNKVFQSTLPSQGATGLETGEYIVKQISIHAPLTGSDGHEVQMVWRRSYFNPRSPHRERHAGSNAKYYLISFQSTLPSQGATFWFRRIVGRHCIFQSTLPSQGAT